jgi:replicative DNA helicase
MDQICTTEKAINDLSEPGQKNQIEDLPAAALPVLDKLEQLRKGELKFTGVPAGLVDLDRITGGWQPGNLIIIAGRTSMGKSTLALSLAVNATEYGQKVAYYSLEMSKEELILKIISKKYKIELNDLKKGQIDEKRLKEIRKEIEKTKRLMFIDDSATMDTQQLRRSAVRLKAREGINLIIVDYLQFLSAAGIKPGQNREQEIAIISRSLKNLAKELAIPVIALSQLSRAVETRGGSMRPRLSDLRESGAIENDADLVIFCYRPEYYKIDTIEHRGVNYNAAGLTLLDIAKDRNIGTQEILTNFSGKFSSFEDYRDDFEPDAVPELFPEPEEKNPWSDS